jgi:hypothetical protein
MLPSKTSAFSTWTKSCAIRKGDEKTEEDWEDEVFDELSALTRQTPVFIRAFLLERYVLHHG